MSLWSKVKSTVKRFFEPEPPKNIPPEPPKEPPREPPREPPIDEGPREPRDRQYWADAVIDRKERIWGDSGRYNSSRAERNAIQGVGGNRPSTALLKWAATTDEANLHIMIRSGNMDYSFLFYK